MSVSSLIGRVRERAFYIWLEEGKPEGKDVEHWCRAERDIAGESGALEPGGGEIKPSQPTGEVMFAAARDIEEGGESR